MYHLPELNNLLFFIIKNIWYISVIKNTINSISLIVLIIIKHDKNFLIKVIIKVFKIIML